MADVAISASGAHASATATDRIPTSKGPFTPGTKGYLTPEQIRAFIIATANTWAATQTITQADNTSALIATGSSLTGANAQSLIDLAQTWNTSGTPTALKLNITDTASNAASLLRDWQVNGNSVASVDKGGRILAAKLTGGSASNVAIGIASSRGLFSPAASMLSVSAGGQDFQFNNASGLITGNSGYFGFSSSASPSSGAVETAVYRDAANTIGQRNGTNRQILRVYGSFTDLSNRENAAIQTGAGYVELAAETAGTGADDLDVRLTPAGAGLVRFGTHGAIGVQVNTGYIEIKDAGGTTRRLAVVS